jgi:catechol 2,3-dioxygenase-like lactoylglutathione lyase family enzyme
MSNTFGTDILIQAKDPMKVATFYVKELGFEITEKTPNLVSLHGKNIHLFIERGPALGPVFETLGKSGRPNGYFDLQVGDTRRSGRS